MVLEQTNLLLAAQAILHAVAVAERHWRHQPMSMPGRAKALVLVELHRQLGRARTVQAGDFLPFFAANDEPDVLVGL